MTRFGRKQTTQPPHLLCMQALLEQQDTDDAVQASQQGGVALEWQRVAELLGRKYDRIDAVQALPLLPLQVNLQGYRHHCTTPPLSPPAPGLRPSAWTILTTHSKTVLRLSTRLLLTGSMLRCMQPCPRDARIGCRPQEEFRLIRNAV